MPRMELNVWGFTFLCTVVTSIFGHDEIPRAVLYQGDPSPNVGLEVVDNCILLEIRGNIEMRPRVEDTNDIVTVEIPRYTVSAGHCTVVAPHMRELTAQEISLYWRDHTELGDNLVRNLTIKFDRNFTAGTYGVSKISAVFETREYVIPKELGNFRSLDNKTEIDYVSMTTSWMSPLEFVTPVYYSYMCIKPRTYSLDTVLHTSIDLPLNTGIKLPSAVLTIHNINFDAFRPQSAHEGQFQETTDCGSRRWWIALVCILTQIIILVIVLVFCFRAIKDYRLKNQIRGYQSL